MNTLTADGAQVAVPLPVPFERSGPRGQAEKDFDRLISAAHDPVERERLKGMMGIEALGDDRFRYGTLALRSAYLPEGDVTENALFFTLEGDEDAARSAFRVDLADGEVGLFVPTICKGTKADPAAISIDRIAFGTEWIGDKISGSTRVYYDLHCPFSNAKTRLYVDAKSEGVTGLAVIYRDPSLNYGDGSKNP